MSEEYAGLAWALTEYRGPDSIRPGVLTRECLVRQGAPEWVIERFFPAVGEEEMLATHGEYAAAVRRAERAEREVAELEAILTRLGKSPGVDVFPAALTALREYADWLAQRRPERRR